MRWQPWLMGIGVAMAVGVAGPAAGQIGSELVIEGLSAPVYVTAPPGDTSRLFIVQQGSTSTDAAIRILDLSTNTLLSQSFLTLDSTGADAEVAAGGERGLLGLAFHPDYATNGRFYVNFTSTDSRTVIREYQASTVNPNVADTASARQILSFARTNTNHNGGWMGFGPMDDYLYIASGDSGGGGDPDNAAQNLAELRGKILRLDIDDDAFPDDTTRNYAIPPANPFAGDTPGADEIWAYGLRNPWRSSFDRATGDFWIADVGQGSREEVNYQPHAAGGGQNYGWDVREGTTGSALPGAIEPIFNYVHNNTADPAGGFSITGGYVYRGPIAELQGHYFFADYISERIWSLTPTSTDPATFDGTNYANFTEWTAVFDPDGPATIDQIASFGEDAAGNLYIVDRGGQIFRIVPEPGALALLAPIVLLLQRRRAHG